MSFGSKLACQFGEAGQKYCNALGPPPGMSWPTCRKWPTGQIIRVDESGQLVLPSSGERVVGWSGFCLPGRVAAAAGL